MGEPVDVLECGTELALPMPGDWSSDESEAAVVPSDAVGRSGAAESALSRLAAVPSHNDAPRALADPQSDGFKALASVGAREPSPAHKCDKMEYADALRPDFAEKYVGGGGRPCIIRNVPREEKWPALEKWSSIGSFVEHHGTVPVQVTEMGSLLGGKPMRVELSVGEFVKYAVENKVDWPYYSWERNWNGERAAILADFSSPVPFVDDLYDLTPEARDFLPLTCHLFVLMGGHRSGSNLHQDPKWSSAWNTVLVGRKRWVLFPPDTPADKLGVAGSNYRSSGPPAYWWTDHYPRLAADPSCGMVDVVQNPGDTIFIPSGWWHAVLNLPGEEGVTLCCTRNCFLPQSLPRVWPLMHKATPDFARHFARMIRRLRPELADLLPTEAAEPVLDAPSKVKSALGEWEMHRRSCESLSLSECREKYIRAGVSLIVTGLGEHVIDEETWGFSREWLRAQVGMKMVAARYGSGCGEAELMPLEEFIRRLDEGEKLYLYDCSLPLQLPTLLPYVRIPRYFAHCRLQRTRLRHCFDNSWPTLFIGAAGTESSLHVDQWYGHFWMTVISGRKHWTIFHPDDAHLLGAFTLPGRVNPSFPSWEEVQKLEGFGKARRISFDVNEGETLFVPGGAPHYVRNPVDSVAVAGNFVDDSNYSAALEVMKKMAGGGDEALAGVVKALEEVDWAECAEPEHKTLLPPSSLVVPFEHVRGGAAAWWPAEPDLNR
eukprot:Hpha_TRINITY_DN7418_c0_g1::TRINITY_DN7418_c0_g1_i1::g.95955::m.95955/K11323/JMJD6; histone arginine demethylase JMJD6